MTTAEKIKQINTATHTISQIAVMIGLHRTTISYHLKKMKLPYKTEITTSKNIKYICSGCGKEKTGTASQKWCPNLECQEKKKAHWYKFQSRSNSEEISLNNKGYVDGWISCKPGICENCGNQRMLNRWKKCIHCWHNAINETNDYNFYL